MSQAQTSSLGPSTPPPAVSQVPSWPTQSLAVPSFITVPAAGIPVGGPLTFTLHRKGADGQMAVVLLAGAPFTAAAREPFLPGPGGAPEPLYVVAGEYDAYHQQAESNLVALLADTNAGPERFEVCYRICAQLLGELMDRGVADLVRRVLALAAQLCQAVSADADCLRQLLAQRAGGYETPSHMVNVALLSLLLAREMNVPPNDWPTLVAGALLHDVGRIGLPEALMAKEGRLSQGEWMLVREHPTRGSQWLRQFEFVNPLLADLAWQHHEMLDGSGYPRSLRGAAIHTWARLYHVLDLFDMLVSAKPFRPGLPQAEALAALVQEAPERLDSAAVTLLDTLVAGSLLPPPAGVPSAGGTVTVGTQKTLPLESYLPLGPLNAAQDDPSPSERRRNRRQFVRHQFKMSCRVRYVRPGAVPDSHIAFWVQARDISRGGMQFLHSTPMRLGEIISVFLPISGAAGRHVSAMIVRCHRAANNVFYIGARFDYDR